MANRDDSFGEPEAQILGFEGEIEADCPQCGATIRELGVWSGPTGELECACGARLCVETVLAPLPRYRPE